MLKVIAKDRLRLGMFVELVQCPASEFNARRFVLQSRRDLVAIRRSSATHVLINAALGVDEDGRRLKSPSEVQDQACTKLKEQVRDLIDRSAADVRSNLESIASGGKPQIDNLTLLAKNMTKLWCGNTPVALEVTRLKSKDIVTYTHSLSVGGLMSLLGTALDLDNEIVFILGVAGIVHDIGKLLIPPEVLMKPGRLTVEESQVVRNHPELGYQLLKEHNVLPETVLSICRLHHELLDGSGYPFGLQADALALPVRIATICDVFDALTTARPYKGAWSCEDALDWMYERPHAFDRKLVIRLGSVLVPGHAPASEQRRVLLE